MSFNHLTTPNQNDIYCKDLFADSIHADDIVQSQLVASTLHFGNTASGSISFALPSVVQSTSATVTGRITATSTTVISPQTDPFLISTEVIDSMYWPLNESFFSLFFIITAPSSTITYVPVACSITPDGHFKVRKSPDPTDSFQGDTFNIPLQSFSYRKDTG